MATATALRSVSADGVVERTLRSDRPQIRHWLRWRRQAARSRRALMQLAVEATGWCPLEWQAELLVAGATDLERGVVHKLALGGYGAGKTDVGAFELLLLVLANPGCRFLAAAPTYDQVEGVLIPAWAALIERMAGRGYRLSWKGVGATSLIDNLICGGRVYFRSYSKVSNLLGFQFAGAWLDELDTVMRPQEVWDTIHSRVRQPGAAWREMLVTTTPDQGESGVAGMWGAARKEFDARDWYWVRGTALDNHHLTPSPQHYVDGLAATMSRREYQVRVLARVLRSRLAVYHEYGGRHVRAWTYDRALPYDLTLDGGDSWPHYLWIQRHPEGWSIVVDEYAPDGVPRDRVRAEVERRCRAMGRPPSHVTMDRALWDDRKWALDQWPGSYVSWCRTQIEQSVAHGVEQVRTLLDPARGDPKLYVARHLAGDAAGRRGIDRCLRHYRHRQRADGMIDPEPYKDNVHDHGADALRYWAVLVATGGAASTVVIPITTTHGAGGRSRARGRRRR